NAAVASITTTETFSSRVPVGLNNVSLGTAPQIEYTDVASFGQNTDASVFAMASDGTLTILKAGAVSVSATLGIQVNTGDVSSTDASLSIDVNGFPRASSFANII